MAGIEVSTISYATRIQQAQHDQAVALVLEALKAIEAGAQQRSAVDTGAQRASTYHITNQEDSYDDTLSAVARANPKIHTVFPKVDAPSDDFTGYVAVAVEYAEINEFDRQAFLSPATEAERPNFEAKAKAAFQG
jgi:hypothetical protein